MANNDSTGGGGGGVSTDDINAFRKATGQDPLNSSGDASADSGSSSGDSADQSGDAAAAFSLIPFAGLASFMDAATAAGDLRVEPETGHAMKKALNDLQAELYRMRQSAGRLTESPPLGTSVYGELLKQWQPTVADGPPESYLPRFTQFTHQLDKLIDSIDTAMRKYQEKEEEQASNINRLQQGIEQ